MIDFRGFWFNAIAGNEVRPPPWLLRAAILVLGVATGVLLWTFGDAAGRTLVVGAAAVALALQLGALLTGLRAALVPLSDAAATAALLALSPLALGLEGEAIERWQVLAAGTALLSAPLLSRIWSALLFAREVAQDTRRRRQSVDTALAGAGDVLVLRVHEHVGAWAHVTIRTNEGDRPARVTISTLRTFAGIHWGPALELEGRSFLLHQPVLEVLGNEGEPRIVGADRVEFLGTHDSGLDPEPFRQEARAALVVLATGHLLIVAAASLATALL